MHLKFFFKQRLVFWSAFFLLATGALAILAPMVTHFSYQEQNLSQTLQSPSFTHLLGTDELGRDLYTRLLYGARMSLAVGIFTAIFALFLGTTTGALAGYWGGWIDRLLMTAVDFFFTFPPLLLAILLTIFLGRGFLGIFLAISLTSWVVQARLVRALFLQAKEQAYVEAAHAIGASHWRIVCHHLLPNMFGAIAVSLTLQIPNNIMTESFLSFIGLGLSPPYASWGTLANEGFRAMRSYPHLTLFPGGILFLTMLAFNFLGDGLRDALDPKITQGPARDLTGLKGRFVQEANDKAHVNLNYLEK